MMKRVGAVVLALLVLSSAMALDITDPSDLIYYDLEVWQEKGYFRHMPELRPYAAQLILEYLETVETKGTPRERETARGYLEVIQQGLGLHGELHAHTRYGREELGDTYGIANFVIRGMVTPELSLWGNVTANANVSHDNPRYYMYYETLPVGERDMRNIVTDTGKIGGISLFHGSSSIMSYGSSELYLNLGLSRSSFGPFQDDGIVISQEAPQQGHYSMTWRGNDFSYTAMMLQLVGTNYVGRDNFSEKYMVLHSYNWAPFDWVDLGFFETVVYGGRFEPLYLIPFSYLFYNQGIVGFADNSLMGLKGRFSLPGRVELNGVVYVDDIGFNDLVKLNFDTKMKIALEMGASWTPDEPWLSRISLDYTAVFPYMYTHYPWGWGTDTTIYADEWEKMNIDNYTHQGQNLGVSLSPNSDRLRLVSDWRLNGSTKLTLTGNYMRHGNASDVFDPTDPDFDDVPLDSSLFDNGANDKGENLVDFLNFLVQPNLEQILQLGLKFRTSVDMPFMDVKRYYGADFEVGYTFEQIWNSGRGSTVGELIPQAGKDETNHYLTFSMRVYL